MPDTAFYYALFRYRVGEGSSPHVGVSWIKSMREGEVAIATRSYERVSEDIMDRLLMHCRETNLIKHREVIRDPFLDYWSGWDKVFSFGLCPCIEIYADSKKHPARLNWDYRVVTP
jgi:hypothetical protein